MSDQIKWTSVYKSINKFEAEVIKGNIENEGIPCVVINKQDSSYLSIVPGMVESVSYTHLDVYKRQVFMLTPSAKKM